MEHGTLTSRKVGAWGRGAVVGTRPLGPSNVKNIPLSVTEQVRCEAYPPAIAELNDVRSGLSYQSPCEKNPPAWSSIERQDADDIVSALARVEESVALCHQCKVYPECRKVLEACRTVRYSPVDGILAGEIIERVPTRAGDWIQNYLTEGTWPRSMPEDKLALVGGEYSDKPHRGRGRPKKIQEGENVGSS